MEYEKINGNVAFNSEAHKYWDITNPDKQYISVTTLIHSYAKPYDKEFWSAYKALEKLLNAEDWNIVKRTLMSTKVFDKNLLSTFGISENDFNREQQGILDAWAEKNRKACDTGTEIHKQFENQFYSKGKDIELPSFGIGGKFECKKDYTTLDLESGIYPEYLLYWESKNGKVRLAGQSDLIIKQGNNIICADHKTSEKIDTKSYYDKYTRKSDKMQYPLNHLDDCNFNYYSMQLSTYAWMLQQINPNFNIQDLIINHYDHEGKNTLYHCKYLRDEVESMLSDYEKKLTLAEKRSARKRIEY